MTPKNINRDHVLQAISEIDKEGVPTGRPPTKFRLIFNGKSYPPKYTIALANKFANGRELKPDEHSGGKESNEFLRSLGFTIKPLEDVPPPPQPELPVPKAKGHNPQCSNCKNMITELLRKLFKEVKIEHDFEVKFPRENDQGQPFYSALQGIRRQLEAFRGHRNFVRMKKIPLCDRYVTEPGFVVELDEPQHFSEARRISLSQYPTDLLLGFSVEEWIDHCKRIQAVDNLPPYRDEQRAWYDSVRDFLPFILGLKPTVRIYMGKFRWCSLDPEKESDVQTFLNLVPGLRIPPGEEHTGPDPSQTEVLCSPNRSKDEKEQVKREGSGEAELAQERSQVASSSPLLLATVVIESSGDLSSGDQAVDLMNAVIGRLCNTVDIILFPAGYFWEDDNFTEFKGPLVRAVCPVLQANTSTSIVCIGIDALSGVDQIAVAVGKDGIVAVGKKFFPTSDEKGKINLAPDPHSGEFGYPRKFTVKGKEAYLAICYDIFGIRKSHIRKRDVDLILNLVHRFFPVGEPGGGDVFFARHGFAGASKEWRCPTYGAARFIDRKVPPNWPTGVLWNLGSKSTKEWRYPDNPIIQPPWERIKLPNILWEAVYRVFSI